MTHSSPETTFESVAARAAPAVFVVLWSTGFVGTKYVLAGAEPLTYLAVRMVLAALLMGLIAAIFHAKWPKGADIFHSAVSGLLVHGFYLGGTAVAIYHSVPAGLSDRNRAVRQETFGALPAPIQDAFVARLRVHERDARRDALRDPSRTHSAATGKGSRTPSTSVGGLYAVAQSTDLD